MNILVAKPASLIRFPDSKDVVDNQPNESRTLKTNQSLNTTAPASPNHNTIPSSISQPLNLSTQMSTPTDQMQFEEQRLKTFKRDWPHTFISPRVLAKTGFYYIGPHDQVRCYFCKVEVGRWENGDNEVNEHSRWSPNCPLLKRRETSNVPLEPVSELDGLLPPQSYDVCGSYGIDVRPGSYTETQFTTSTSTETEDQPPRLNNHHHHHHHQIERETQTLKHPDFPQYAIESARLRSFDEWPKTSRQRPQQLSDAGFFYTQRSDRVICFSCGGGLRDWDDQDDPWEQHALHYGKCDYLLLVKGPEFVEAVKAKYSKSEGEKNNGGLSSSSQESVASSCGSSTSSTSSSASSGHSVSAPASVNLMSDKEDQSQDCTNCLCKICYSSVSNVAFFPCRHLIACAKCASSVTKCPLCRKPFERVEKMFFS